MKSILITISIVFCYLNASAQQADWHIYGKITDLADSSVVPGVHVINKSQGQGTVSDIDGNFRLKAFPQDTIIFSSVGYQRQQMILPSPQPGTDGWSIWIALEKSTLELETVDVLAYRNEQDFKDAIIAYQLPEEQKTEIYVPGFYNGPKQPVKPGVGSPISFLSDKLGKRARTERKFEAAKKQDQRWFRYSSKYNKEIVSRITGLKDQALDDFMEFCSLSESFILESNEYEIIVAVNNCYQNFKSKN